MKDLVFEEVMETEMALTRLEIESYEKAIPSHIRTKSNKSLLYRMNTLKQRLLGNNPFGNSSRKSFDTDDENAISNDGSQLE